MALVDIATKYESVAAVLEDPTVGHQQASELVIQLGFQTTEASVRRYRAKTGWVRADDIPLHTEPVEGDEDEEEPDLSEVIAALEASNRRLYKQATEAKRNSESLIEAVYRAAFDSATLASTRPKIVVPPKLVARSGKKEEVALFHMTDWQAGKITETYNSDLMAKRVDRFMETALDIVEDMRLVRPVRKAVILLTGDMVEGVKIFPGQEFEIDADLYTQIFNVVEKIEDIVRLALEHFEEVSVVAEYGNHGRIGNKAAGFKPSDNIDRIVYGIAARRLNDLPRFTGFQTSAAWFQHFTIGNYTAIAIHGDEIKSFGGNTPSYGILRKANQWASGVVPNFKDVYMGHYHQHMELQLANGGKVYMTGSTESDNIYAQEFVAATGTPTQRLHFIEPERGIVTSRWIIEVDDEDDPS